VIIKAECPFCDWQVRQETGDKDKTFIRGYLAKALIGHLHVNHARHDEKRIQNIGFSTIMGNDTNQGMVEFSLNQEITQMDLDKAREVHRMLGEAIEAAVSDWLIFKFFIEKVGFDKEKAAVVLMDFRELRHGSRAGGSTSKEN
jgi:hypothetical protein